MDIKEIREALNWTQQKMAEEIGVSFVTVNRWENKKTKPSPMALKKLKELEAQITR